MFADVLFLALFRFFRRWFRVYQASRWPSTIATAEGWTCVNADGEFRGWNEDLQVRADLTYEVSGKSYQGMLKSVGYKPSVAWECVDRAPVGLRVMIRYHPEKPERYRVLPEDNGIKLGFYIAVY